MKLVVSDGHEIAYSHQPGLTPGIVFCSGFNSDMQGTKAQALAQWCLDSGRQFTRFDYLGHGQSSGKFVDGTIGRWRDDALAVLDEVTTGPQVMIGSSMGGWIMLLAALARPERIAALVGIAAAPDFTEQMRETRLSAKQLNDLSNQGFCDLPNCYDDGEPYRISMNLLDEGRNHLLLDKPIPIACPVRLLQGQLDEDVPWQHALAIAESIISDDVEVTLIKSGDHRLSEPVDLDRLFSVVERLLQNLET